MSAEQKSSYLPIWEVYHSRENTRVQPHSQAAMSETRPLSVHAGTQTWAVLLFIWHSKTPEDNIQVDSTSLYLLRVGRQFYSFCTLWNTQYNKSIGILQGTLNKPYVNRKLTQDFCCCCCSVPKAPYAGSHKMLLFPPLTTSELTTGILAETSWGSFGDSPAPQSQHTRGIVLQTRNLLVLQGESIWGGQMSQSHA